MWFRDPPPSPQMAYGFIHTQEADDTDIESRRSGTCLLSDVYQKVSASSAAVSAIQKPTTEIGRMFPAAYKSETRKTQCVLKKDAW